MQDKIRTALISFGMSGEVFHGPLLTSHGGFDICSILERTKNCSAQKYPYANIKRTFEEVLADSAIELVIVNTPDDSHYEYCKASLNAGKHAVVEKPFTIKSGHAVELIDIAKKKKLVLSVFQNRRWDNDFLTVKHIIATNKLGRLVEFESHFDRFRPVISGSWKETGSAGTGTLYNLGSHLIDQALVLFGMPLEVYADIQTMRENAGADDYYDIKLFYSNFRVILKSSYIVKECGPRFSLHGTKGSFVKYGLDPQEQALKDGFLPVDATWGAESSQFWGVLNTIDASLIEKVPSLAGNYQAFYNSIYNAIRKSDALLVRPEEALQTIQIIEACIESSRMRKNVVVG